ncbi:MAG TPA: hypothetical protein H9697_10255 [Candidatus Mediterraneibacter faecavium]|uniref:Uncharacterized protein n=1 Tax=Candidatus Mediterraneibacter faecavium TaxID=2838668 RepID=A0A9D2QC12_9FIRM|nr:hypothetical protein [Candidatus Mediterraneibacter faecavium]
MLKLKSDRYFSVAEEHENEITIIANEDVKDTYLELAKDVTLTVSQYMSTENRPIYSWDVPKDASLLNDDSLRAEPEKLPQGFICERVNISDWESERCIGGVFNGSCWAETSNLLVLAEVVPAMKKKQYF